MSVLEATCFSAYLFSDSDEEQQACALDYLAGKIAYPHPSSFFDRSLGVMKYTFRVPGLGKPLAIRSLRALEKRGYDVLLLDQEGVCVGHVAFQEHDQTDWHVFAVERDGRFKGQRAGTCMIEHLIKKAREKEKRRIRIGGGGSVRTNSIYADIVARGEQLGVIGEHSNWVRVLSFERLS